jgi:hypothetical protein
MTLVTVLAREIKDRWPALTSVMWAPARWAMDCKQIGRDDLVGGADDRP